MTRPPKAVGRRGPVRLLLRTIEWGGSIVGAGGLLLWGGRGALTGGLGGGVVAALALGVAAFVALRLLELAERGRRALPLRLGAAAAILAGAAWASRALRPDLGWSGRTTTWLVVAAWILTGASTWALLAGLTLRAVPTGSRALVPARLAAAALGVAIATTSAYFLAAERGVLRAGEQAFGTVGAVSSIVAALLLLATWAAERWSDRAASASARTIEFRCPRCGRAGRMRAGGDRCDACGLGITVRVT